MTTDTGQQREKQVTDNQPTKQADQPEPTLTTTAIETDKDSTATAKADAPMRWTRYLFMAAAVVWAWHIVADRITPYSEHARVRTYITPIVPQVSGRIVEVGVEFSQPVQAGDLLFSIDAEQYQLALDKAQASLDQVMQNVGANSDDIITAETKLTQAKTTLEYAETEKRRYDILNARGVISESEYNLVQAKVKNARSEVRSATAELTAAQQKLGDSGNNNPKVREALSRFRLAQLDLSRTRVSAPSDGAVTNAIIAQGQYAKQGQPMMTFLDTRLVWVEAYLRENSLGNVKPGAKVDIALDFAPGKVFAGQVSALTYGVNWNNANQTASALPTIAVDEGWLRDSQRFPVVIHFTEDIAKGYRLEGGQADVVIYTGNNPIFNGFSWLKIRLMSLLSYLY